MRTGTLFQLSEISRLIGIRTVRLSKLVASPGYGIEPSIRHSVGKGRPSLYSLEDLLRIAVTWWLFQAGFRSKVIARVLRDKGLMKALKDPKQWTSQTPQNSVLLIKREIKGDEAPPQDVRLATLAEVRKELELSARQSIQVIPLGDLLTDLWERLQ